MESWLKPLVDAVGGVLSGYPLVVTLLGAGVYFTVRFGGIQIRALWHSISLLRSFGTTSGISPFQAFATGLASRVGTGNIAGVAVALRADHRWSGRHFLDVDDGAARHGVCVRGIYAGANL